MYEKNLCFLQGREFVDLDVRFGSKPDAASPSNSAGRTATTNLALGNSPHTSWNDTNSVAKHHHHTSALSAIKDDDESEDEDEDDHQDVELEKNQSVRSHSQHHQGRGGRFRSALSSTVVPLYQRICPQQCCGTGSYSPQPTHVHHDSTAALSGRPRPSKVSSSILPNMTEQSSAPLSGSVVDEHSLLQRQELVNNSEAQPPRPSRAASTEHVVVVTATSHLQHDVGTDPFDDNRQQNAGQLQGPEIGAARTQEVDVKFESTQTLENARRP